MAIRVSEFHAKAAEAYAQKGYLAIEQRHGEERLVVRGTSLLGRLFGVLKPGSHSASVIRAYRDALQREHPDALQRLPEQLARLLPRPGGGQPAVTARRVITAFGASATLRDAESSAFHKQMWKAREKRTALLEDAVTPRIGAAARNALNELQASEVLQPHDLQPGEINAAALLPQIKAYIREKGLRSDALDDATRHVVKAQVEARRPLLAKIEAQCADRPADRALYRSYVTDPRSGVDAAKLDLLLAAGRDHRRVVTDALREIAGNADPATVDAAVEKLFEHLQRPVNALLGGDQSQKALTTIAGDVVALALREAQAEGLDSAVLYRVLLGSDAFMGGVAVRAALNGNASQNPVHRFLAAPFDTLQQFGNLLQQAARDAGAAIAEGPAFNTLFDPGSPVVQRYIVEGDPASETGPDISHPALKAVSEDVIGVRFPLRSEQAVEAANRRLALDYSSGSPAFAAYVAQQALRHHDLADAQSPLSVATRRAVDQTLPERLARAGAIDLGVGEVYSVFELTGEQALTLMRACVDEALKGQGGVA